MHGHCLSLVIVCLLSIFLHFSAAGPFWTSAKNTHFCFWTGLISNGQTHYMFLHQATVGKERSFVLFDSIWNKENSLVKCIKSNNHFVIKSFSSKCWKARDRPFSDIPDRRFNISTLVEPGGPCLAVGPLPDLRVPVRRSRDVESMDCRTVSQNRGECSETLKRSKRAWMIPGTLWCGSGNKASNFSDLGLFEETDKCCRDHDHCEQTIASFEFSYGIFNSNFFTLSHCGCDSKFHRCLHSANDRMSDVVGYGYFNVLKMRCFEFSQRMKCAEWTWWGMCKHSKLTTYGLLKEAIDYNSTFSVLEDEKLDLYHTMSFGDLTVTNDLLMPSDTVTKDASQKHSSVLVPQWLSVTVNRSQQPERHGKTLTTHTTDSSETETTDSSETKPTNNPMIITDLEQRQTSDASNSNITDSTNLEMTEATDLPNTETTDSSTPETTDLTNTETTDLPNTETTILANTETTDLPNTETTDLPNTETTDSSTPETTDLSTTETTDSSTPETTDLSTTETTDLSTPEATDLSTTEATDSSTPEATDSIDLETTQLSNLDITDSSKTEATDSTNPETTETDFPNTETDTSITETKHSTDSSQPGSMETDSTKIQTDSPKTHTTDSPKTHTTDSPKTHTTDSPKTHTTDLLKTQTRDLTKTKIKAETADTLQINSACSSKIQNDSTTDSPKPRTTDSPKMRLHPETHTRRKNFIGNLDTCEAYKDLDSCHYQIVALGEKFGLHNAEHTTMYHCNCTARLAKELAEEDEVDKVHFWLLDFVSRSCFILPQNCTGTESCSSSSSSSSSNDAPLVERWSNGAAVWRHLAASRRKNKRLNNKRSKRKDSPIRLYKKCLRMYSKLHAPKTFKRKEVQQLSSE